MQDEHYNIQRFLVISDLYFRLTDKTASDVSDEELLEFLEFINDCSLPLMSPEQYVS